MAHLYKVLKFSRSFDTQWNLLCWKYKINEFYFGTNTKSTNLRIQELVIFTKPRKLIPMKKSTFTVYRDDISFTGGGNKSTRRIQPTCRKSLTNFITWCCDNKYEWMPEPYSFLWDNYYHV